MTKNTVIRISLNILPRYIVPAREKVDLHTVIRISLKILPRYIVPAREKVDSMEKRIFGILQKSSYITLG